MGLIPVQAHDDYRLAIRRLFPPGEFWDRQFADPQSDLSLWCDTKAAELLRRQQRRVEAFDESVVDTSTELLDDWERVHGLNNSTLSTEVRRQIIKARRVAVVNWPIVADTVANYGGTLQSGIHPYRPSIFGATTFGLRFATPAAFNVIHLIIEPPAPGVLSDMEAALAAQLMAYHITAFVYEEG
jgi:hypothetical protein